jgi:tetratricopeptide (TPR) repeat protein/transcriptional regulator with XRE-family HTH domain
VTGPDRGVFGDALRRLRAEAGLTQEQLAEAAGVSPRAVSDLERGVNRTARRPTARLLADALGLAGSARADFEAAAAGQRPAGRAAHTLPRDAAAFTGRAAELAEVAAAAAEAEDGALSVCVIGGMAGIGKTALAVHAAHRHAPRFPGGRLFVPLHGHTAGLRPADPADVLADLLATAGVPASQVPAGLDGRVAAWRNHLAGRHVLLILDDAVSSSQVRPLLPGTPGCLVLVTSRSRLTALEDARPITLDPLAAADSAVLITRLAGRPGLDPGDPAVAGIAAMSGHLPLAAGILARQLYHHPAWDPASLAAELSAARDRLDLMRAEDQEVAAAFRLSYADLTDRQQRLFTLLGLHPGTDIDARAAAALAGTPAAAARGDLRGLQDHHLITEPAAGRYRFHDLLREHARSLAEDVPAPEREAALGRLLDYYQGAAARAGALLARRARLVLPSAAPADACPEDCAQALAWARDARASLLACLDHVTRAGQQARVVALSSGLAELLRIDGPWAEAAGRHRAAIAAARDIGDRLGEASALTDLGTVQRLAGDHPGAARTLDQSLRLCRDLGSRLGEAGALHELGIVGRMTGDYPAATQALARALRLCRDLGNRLGEAGALHELGIVQRLADDLRLAARTLSESLRIFRELGSRLGEANALHELGTVLTLTGDYPAAATANEQALRIHRDLGNRLGEANALQGLGLVRRTTGDHLAAGRVHAQALRIYRDIASRHGEANALRGLGAVLRATGRYPAAARSYEQALRIYRDIGDRDGEVVALNEQGLLHQARGELARARTSHRQALDLARAIASASDEAGALAGLGRCAHAAGDLPQADDLARQAAGIFARIGAPEPGDLLAELGARQARSLAAPALLRGSAPAR